MTKAPQIGFDRLSAALRRDGWIIVRRRGSHIRLHKSTREGRLKLTVPADSPTKRSTLAYLLKCARLSVDDLMRLL
ncbi:MAG: type II toxin-antitoxin system HicA family toxin [Candidatus Aminicenantes bacterium]|nr:type II toxin-antitoxin system HicA family toxin [Candidatus Aminicenantes bacterium]